MVSSISTLSLFTLVLISGYFTLPIDQDLTTQKSFNSRTIFGNDIDTTQINDIKRSVDEHSKFDILGVTIEPEHEKRMVEEFFTTEETLPKRSINDFSVTTAEPSEEINHNERMVEEFFTTEETFPKRSISDLSMTTIESTTNDMENELHHGKREFESNDSTATFSTEFSSVSTPLFTSTSSAVAPELYTTDASSLRKTTQKYVGSLVDREENDDEEEEKPKQIKSKSNKQFQEEHVELDNEKSEDKHNEEGEEKPKQSKSKSNTYRHEDHEESEVKHKGEEEEEESPVKKPIKPSSKLSEKESTESKDDKTYVKAKLSDQVSPKFFPQSLNSRVAIYDSADDVTPKTNKVSKTKETPTKLTQGEESS